MALTACLDTKFYFALAGEKPAWALRVLDEAKLAGSRVVSSTVTIAELLSTMGAAVGLETVRLRIASVIAAGVEFVPLSASIASQAGEMLMRVKDLPLADAIIGATAIKETNGRVYSDDQHFKTIPGVKPVWGRA